MSTAQFTQTTSKALNQELAAVNGYFRLFPLYKTVEIVNQFDLDASQIVQNFKGDKGRMNVALSDSMYLCMIWERMESGSFEVIAYASSVYDDVRLPYTTVMTAKERKQAAQSVTNGLAKLPQYSSKGAFFSAVEGLLSAAKLDYSELQDVVGTGTAGDEGRLHVSIGQNLYLVVSWYRMPSGSYEMVAYVS